MHVPGVAVAARAPLPLWAQGRSAKVEPHHTIISLSYMCSRTVISLSYMRRAYACCPPLLTPCAERWLAGAARCANNVEELAACCANKCPRGVCPVAELPDVCDRYSNNMVRALAPVSATPPYHQRLLTSLVTK
eukprot:6003002-Pyramimonas_sp.AAC.1